MPTGVGLCIETRGNRMKRIRILSATFLLVTILLLVAILLRVAFNSRNDIHDSPAFVWAAVARCEIAGWDKRDLKILHASGPENGLNDLNELIGARGWVEIQVKDSNPPKYITINLERTTLLSGWKVIAYREATDQSSNTGGPGNK